MHGYPDLLPGPPGLRPPPGPHDLMYHPPPPDHLLPPHEGPPPPDHLLPPHDGPPPPEHLLPGPGGDLYPEREGPDYTYLDTSDDSGRHTGPDQPSP